MALCLLSSLLILSKNLQPPSIRAFSTNPIASATATSTLRNMSGNSATPTPIPTRRDLVVDPFCFRQFREHPDKNTGYTGSIFEISIAQFEEIVNQRYSGDESQLQPGYAPFCKHLFVENNFTDATTNVLKITPENEHLLRTKYEVRNEQELPVLQRFFPKELLEQDRGFLDLPKAKYLDLILYSRKQINAENAAQAPLSASPESAPWGIVSIKAQDMDVELPMNPITNMRNALGKEHGGSGIALDRDTYMDAVNYWKDHAVVT